MGSSGDRKATSKHNSNPTPLKRGVNGGSGGLSSFRSAERPILSRPTALCPLEAFAGEAFQRERCLVGQPPSAVPLRVALQPFGQTPINKVFAARTSKTSRTGEGACATSFFKIRSAKNRAVNFQFEFFGTSPGLPWILAFPAIQAPPITPFLCVSKVFVLSMIPCLDECVDSRLAGAEQFAPPLNSHLYFFPLFLPPFIAGLPDPFSASSGGISLPSLST